MKSLLAFTISLLLLLSQNGCASIKASNSNNNTNSDIIKNEAENVNKDVNITNNRDSITSESLAIKDAPKNFLPPNATNKLTLVSQNMMLALYVDRKTGLVGLLDKQYGKYYYSSPPDVENNPGIDVMYKDTANSQIIINAVDNLGNKIQLLSMTDSVLNEGIFVKKVQDAVICTYTFKEKGLVVPIEFSLGSDYLQVRIDPSLIKEQNEYKIYSIKVMPYFGAIRGDESGYLFVPDGSGAIFKANASLNGTFYADIFGYEDVLEKEAIKNYQEKLLLPVFGIKGDSYGFLGIIDSAYAKCGIGVENAEELMQVNNVYPVFNMRTITNVNLPSKNWVTKSVLVLEKHADLTVPFVARYYPLKKDKNEYFDMALRYRDYLIQDKKVKPLKDSELYDGYLDLYGYIKKQKSFIGWPMVIDQKLTTLSQVKEVISDFSQKDLRLGVKYSGWIEDGYFNKIPRKANIAKSIGSKKELMDLNKYAKERNITLFPAVDIITAYKSGNGFNAFKHATKTVNNIAYTQYFYPINLQYKSFEFANSRLLSPNYINKFAENFFKSYNLLDIGAVAFDDIGNKVYSDYGSDSCSRYKAVENLSNLFNSEAKKNEILVSAAASYSIGAVKHSIAAPYESSNYLISDRAVPFYQIALRGLVNISSPSINMESEPKKVVLKCFETGTLPMFSFIRNNTEVLKGSSLNSLYAADYNKWKDYSQEVLTSFGILNRQIKGKKITQHIKLENDVFKTTFDGGTVVIVNYNNTERTVDNKKLQPYGYLIVKE